MFLTSHVLVEMGNKLISSKHLVPAAANLPKVSRVSKVLSKVTKVWSNSVRAIDCARGG